MRRPRRHCLPPEAFSVPHPAPPRAKGVSDVTTAPGRAFRERAPTFVDPSPPAPVRSWRLVIRLEREARRLQQLRDTGLFRPSDAMVRAILADWRRLLGEELHSEPRDGMQ